MVQELLYNGLRKICKVRLDINMSHIMPMLLAMLLGRDLDEAYFLVQRLERSDVGQFRVEWSSIYLKIYLYIYISSFFFFSFVFIYNDIVISVIFMNFQHHKLP